VSRGGGTFLISAEILGVGAESVDAVHLELETATGQEVLDSNGQPVTTITLAARTAGPPSAYRFTSDPLRPVDAEPRPVASRFPLTFSAIHFQRPDATVTLEFTERDRPAVVLYDVDRAIVPLPPVIDVATDARRSPHAVSLAMPIGDQVPRTRDGTAMARLYFERFSHEPDFLIIHQADTGPIRTGSGSILYGQFGRSRNDVSGIGIETYQPAEPLGDDDRLQGIVYIYGGPPTSNGLIVHELLHRWAAFLDPDLGVAFGGHWAASLERSFNGFAGGRYNDLDLYLMGLLPPDSVLPARIGTTRTTIQDVIARHGPRSPAWPNAQNEFTSVTVVVYPRLLTADELALFDFLAAEFGLEEPYSGDTRPGTTTFFQATGGRARLITELPDQAGNLPLRRWLRPHHWP
jgi:hypothetical protein